jgi:hypothetical protein
VELRSYIGRGGRRRRGGEEDPGGPLEDQIWRGGDALPAAVRRGK